MARKAAATTTAVAEKPTNMMQAVRMALVVHPKAKPKQLVEFIKENYGIEMPAQRVSVYKLQINKKGKRRKAKAGAKVVGRKVGRPKSSDVSNLSAVDFLAAKKVIQQLGGPERVSQILALLKNDN